MVLKYFFYFSFQPRLEEDKINAKLDLKRYKENKEKLRKRKELALLTASSSKYKKKAKSSKQKKPEVYKIQLFIQNVTG